MINKRVYLKKNIINFIIKKYKIFYKLQIRNLKIGEQVEKGIKSV